MILLTIAINDIINVREVELNWHLYCSFYENSFQKRSIVVRAFDYG
jgi:hypothetical protein